MQGEEYLSKTNQKRLKGYRNIVLEAYNRYFHSLFPLDNLDCKGLIKLLGEAQQKGDILISGSILEIYRLEHKASKGYNIKHPIYIAA